MRTRTAVLALLILVLAAPAGASGVAPSGAAASAVGFLTQKELVGREGDTLVVLPPYTYVTVIQRFGDYACITYRVGENMRELRVRQGDLDAARPDEKQAGQTADAEKLLALYRERVLFDVYIDEFQEPPPPGSDEQPAAPPRYRLRIKMRNLTPNDLSNVRFEVQVYLDATAREQPDCLWQLRILGARPTEFRTAETPLFSEDTVRAQARRPAAPKSTDAAAKPQSPPAAEASDAADAEQETEPAPPAPMRFAVRLFIDERFVCQKSGVVKQIDEEEDDQFWEIIPPGSNDSSRLRYRLPPTALPSR